MNHRNQPWKPDTEMRFTPQVYSTFTQRLTPLLRDQNGCVVSFKSRKNAEEVIAFERECNKADGLPKQHYRIHVH